MKKLNKSLILLSVSLLFIYFTINGAVIATSSSEISQEIVAGTLSLDIVNAALESVDTPSIELESQVFNFNCHTVNSVLGVSSEQLYIVNPDAADAGWDISISGLSVDSVWQAAGDGRSYDYNDTGDGCTDNGDNDSFAGKLTIGGDGAVLIPRKGTVNGIVSQASAAFVESSTDSITVFSATDEADDFGAWSLQGIPIAQTIPAEQPVDVYTLQLSITVSAK